MNARKYWLLYSLLVVATWGVWGAFSDLPVKAGFPDTLVYVVWALTMIPPAVIALHLAGWKLDRDRRAILAGCAAGLLGAGGQLLLFKLLTLAPAYLVFPLIALSPAVTVIMAIAISRERASPRGRGGIVLALAAGVLLSYAPPGNEVVKGGLWVILALLILLAWGVQGFVISRANRFMSAEGIFFYMMLGGLLLIPVALAMTDFAKPVNWGWRGPPLAAAIQLLNACGALLLVYAFRYGRAIIVAPLVNAAPPVLTMLLSLALFGRTLHWVNTLGVIAAVIAIVLMALEEEANPDSVK
jgi:drug/metabolite transporter (DMT)-like permease